MPDVTVGYSKHFGENVTMLAQQRGSKLRGAVDVETGIVGEEAFFDQVGETEGQEITVRYGDSPNNEVYEDRRRVAPYDWDWGKLFDSIDKIRRLTDPTNQYVRAAAYSFGRKIDTTIISAATGTAMTGKDGSTAVVLPSTQKIAVNFGGANIGLSLDKLIATRGVFGKNDIDVDDPMNKLYFVISQKQLDDMLNIEELTSSDYAAVKALVNGDINTFMGFEFIRTELLAHDAATDIRTCFAFCKSGIKLAIWKDIMSRITERGDKKFMWYAYMRMAIGATRMEEKKVVEVACDESP
jgi:hypothetical protein